MVRRSRKSREEWKIYKNVFDSFTEKSLFKLSSQGYFEELASPVALGKEANVFLARTKEGSVVIVKIYRLENCNFNKMYSYIRADPRFEGLENQKRKIVFGWVQREYRNLMIAREKARVPTPIAFKDNIVVMESIGGGEPSPKLKDKPPENPLDFMEKTLEGIKSFIDVGLVHGDLSDFNILNDEEQPVFIDLSQGTVIEAPTAKELLERDLKNVLKYFSRLLEFDVEKKEKEVMDYFNGVARRQGLKKKGGYHE